MALFITQALMLSHEIEQQFANNIKSTGSPMLPLAQSMEELGLEEPGFDTGIVHPSEEQIAELEEAEEKEQARYDLLKQELALSLQGKDTFIFKSIIEILDELDELETSDSEKASDLLNVEQKIKQLQDLLDEYSNQLCESLKDETKVDSLKKYEELMGARGELMYITLRKRHDSDEVAAMYDEIESVLAEHRQAFTKHIVIGMDNEFFTPAEIIFREALNRLGLCYDGSNEGYHIAHEFGDMVLYATENAPPLDMQAVHKEIEKIGEELAEPGQWKRGKSNGYAYEKIGHPESSTDFLLRELLRSNPNVYSLATSDCKIWVEMDGERVIDVDIPEELFDESRNAKHIFLLKNDIAEYVLCDGLDVPDVEVRKRGPREPTA